MNFEQYLRKKEIEKLAKEAAKKSVAEIMGELSMFKVGDKVVRLDIDSPHIYSIMRIEDDVFTIGRKIRHRTWGTWLECNQIRPATPEEIAAGHRIDNVMGDDSHIENHISKNCKVIDYD